MKLPPAIRRAPTTIRSAFRDMRHGRPLGGTVRTRFAHLGAFHTTNSPYADLDRLFATLEIGPADVIVDVGCGKGRALNWFIEHYPRNRIKGIELDPDICRKTAYRLRRRPNVTILCGDAPTLLPADGTVFYLFNPFDGDVMNRFATALLELPAATVVYYRPLYLEPFEASPRFAVTELDDPALGERAVLIRLS
ncbi:MAG TPA: class I SAM-dependent methyltransferase [Gaiellaceae bacterium]|jgi:SAM-dependent methyltransferase|nr:class I SAM-dependent methyltransferase [Gaiellaceae bacterium]